MIEPTKHQEAVIARLADDHQAIKVVKKLASGHLVVETGYFAKGDRFDRTGEYRIPPVRGEAVAL